MLWIMAEGNHPLRTFLRSHIRVASGRRWGTLDLSWLVSKCGIMQISGSAPWQNLCIGWMSLKKMLRPRRPANLEEWGQLPLWRPHLNDRNAKLVKCTTRAQRLLRESGFNSMCNVSQGGNGFISWETATRRGANPACEGAFRNLLDNLQENPTMDQGDTLHEFYLEDSDQM